MPIDHTIEKLLANKTITVHIDTEFTDFSNGDLISIGCAADNDSEFYGENSDFNKSLSSDFVKDHVYPLLTPESRAMKRPELASRLWQWFNDLPTEFIVIAFDYSTDYDLLIDLLGEIHPKIIEARNIYNAIYFSIDEQTKALGGSGTDYENRVKKVKAKFELYLMDYFFRTKEKNHHALSDAKANREAYSKLVNEFGLPK